MFRMFAFRAYRFCATGARILLLGRSARELPMNDRPCPRQDARSRLNPTGAELAPVAPAKLRSNSRAPATFFGLQRTNENRREGDSTCAWRVH